MPSLLLWQRDISDDAAGVQNTFSSWDSCMAESYCKWPAIIGIVVGSLIVISIIWCCARCLCCGAECCCGCLSCFNRCCPSPRKRNSGYEKPQPYNGSYNTQYQSPAPMYFGGGYRAPQTATFDTPSNKPDALPAMPTWSTAQSKKVEDDSVELEKMDPQQGLLHQRHESEDSFEDGDLGGMQSMFAQNAAQRQQQQHPQPTASTYPPASSYQNPYQSSYQDETAQYSQNTYQAQQQPSYQAYPSQAQAQAGPYEQANSGYGQFSPYNQPTSQHDYSQHQQFAGSPTSTAAPSAYLPTYQTRPPSSVYTNAYAAPPSYRTAPSEIASPTSQYAPMNNYGMARKPVSGSWRDV